MKYDVVVVVKADQEEKATLEKMTTLLEKEGFTVLEKSWWGKKTLAYPIKKFTEANYMSFVLESTKAKPTLLESRFKLDDTFLRFLILRKEEPKKAKKTAKA